MCTSVYRFAPYPARCTVPAIRARQSPQLDLLVNPNWEEEVDREPLLAFSFYLSGRVNVLRCLADEIEDHLDKSVVKDTVEYWQVERAESSMWLWVLGAYEVIRTITQAKSCFADEFQERLALLKKDLTSVRMPAAKMKKPGKTTRYFEPLSGSMA